MIMAAFYPGAGTDLAPPISFPKIKTWWYMDCQPRSEFGYHTGFYRERFLGHLDQTMTQCGFDLQMVEGDLRTYYSPSTEQTIYYETNTVFPDGWDPVRHKGDTLVLCGYDILGGDDEQGSIPPDFFSSYSHIITDNLTCQSGWENYPYRKSTICYDKEWSYWLIEENTADNFRRFTTVQQNIK